MDFAKTISRVQESLSSDEELGPLDFTDEFCSKFQVDIVLRDKPTKDGASCKPSIGDTVGTFTGQLVNRETKIAVISWST